MPEARLERTRRAYDPTNKCWWCKWLPFVIVAIVSLFVYLLN